MASGTLVSLLPPPKDKTLSLLSISLYFHVKETPPFLSRTTFPARKRKKWYTVLCSNTDDPTVEFSVGSLLLVVPLKVNGYLL